MFITDELYEHIWTLYELNHGIEGEPIVISTLWLTRAGHYPHLFYLVAELVKNRLQCRRPGFDPWDEKISWRRERLPTPVFWPGEFYGLYSPRGRKELEHDWATCTFFFGSRTEIGFPASSEFRCGHRTELFLGNPGISNRCNSRPAL